MNIAITAVIVIATVVGTLGVLVAAPAAFEGIYYGAPDIAVNSLAAGLMAYTATASGGAAALLHAAGAAGLTASATAAAAGVGGVVGGEVGETAFAVTVAVGGAVGYVASLFT
ncbi:hypothetical protein DPEC_G00315290 [Dallia pectoralis]|uniref:Uncharacterized protein n=1 Tax=Dallia pectoralis TaxID=75939 RepID=A0ACC2FCN5_DALPE|nr:hypothetical protein DPEC_G00315290 [Dallia pectoralis]